MSSQAAEPSHLVDRICLVGRIFDLNRVKGEDLCAESMTDNLKSKFQVTYLTSSLGSAQFDCLFFQIQTHIYVRIYKQLL